MIRKIAILATAGVFAATAAIAQTPPPGNVNPGSMKSGAEESGASNQPRSPGNERGGVGTTGTGMGSGSMAPMGPQGGSTRDGINANTNPGSKESGSEPAGEPANRPR